MKANYIVNICQIPMDKVKLRFEICYPLRGEIFDMFFLTSVTNPNRFVCITPVLKWHDDPERYIRTEVYINGKGYYRFERWQFLERHLRERRLRYLIKDGVCTP